MEKNNATYLGTELEKAGLPVEEANTLRPKGRIIQNTDANRLERPRNSEYIRLTNLIRSEAETLRDIFMTTPLDRFEEVYRDREGQHPITFDTEIIYRLNVALDDLRKVIKVFRLEKPNYVKEAQEEEQPTD